MVAFPMSRKRNRAAAGVYMESECRKAPASEGGRYNTGWVSEGDRYVSQSRTL